MAREAVVSTRLYDLDNDLVGPSLVQRRARDSIFDGREKASMGG